MPRSNKVADIVRAVVLPAAIPRYRRQVIKAVLVCLASYADDDTGRNAYPSRETIAWQCAVSERTVKRSLDCLVEHGLITVQALHRQHRTTTYALDLDRLRALAPPRPPEGSSMTTLAPPVIEPAVTSMSTLAAAPDQPAVTPMSTLADRPAVTRDQPGVTRRRPAVTRETPAVTTMAPHRTYRKETGEETGDDARPASEAERDDGPLVPATAAVREDRPDLRPAEPPRADDPGPDDLDPEAPSETCPEGGPDMTDVDFELADDYRHDDQPSPDAGADHPPYLRAFIAARSKRLDDDGPYFTDDQDLRLARQIARVPQTQFDRALAAYLSDWLVLKDPFYRDQGYQFKWLVKQFGKILAAADAYGREETGGRQVQQVEATDRMIAGYKAIKQAPATSPTVQFAMAQARATKPEGA